MHQQIKLRREQLRRQHDMVIQAGEDEDLIQMIEGQGVMKATVAQTDRSPSPRKKTKAKYMETKKNKLKKIDLSSKQHVILHIHQIAKEAGLTYEGLDEENYPVYVKSAKDLLDGKIERKDFDSINKTYLTQLQEINRQNGQQRQTFNFQNLKELQNIETNEKHRNLQSF